MERRRGLIKKHGDMRRVVFVPELLRPVPLFWLADGSCRGARLKDGAPCRHLLQETAHTHKMFSRYFTSLLAITAAALTD